MGGADKWMAEVHKCRVGEGKVLGIFALKSCIFGVKVTDAVHHHWFSESYSENTDLKPIYICHNFRGGGVEPVKPHRNFGPVFRRLNARLLDSECVLDCFASYCRFRIVLYKVCSLIAFTTAAIRMLSVDHWTGTNATSLVCWLLTCTVRWERTANVVDGRSSLASELKQLDKDCLSHTRTCVHLGIVCRYIQGTPKSSHYQIKKSC